MQLVFICGPYRNDDPWECELNIRRAEEMAHLVAHFGGFPVCPHSNTRPYFAKSFSQDTEEDDALWLEGTQTLMSRCDAVMLLENWEDSSGARAEKALAVERNMPVFGNILALRDWLKDH